LLPQIGYDRVMISQAELDRALARFKARKLGHDAAAAVPVVGADGAEVGFDGEAGHHPPVEDERTRIATPYYAGDVETPTGEVHISGDDYDEEPR
jgi:hypothetical protein